MFEDVKRAVDLCAAPRSWSQVLAARLPTVEAAAATVAAPEKTVAVDLQEMAPIEGIRQVEGDITTLSTAEQITGHFGGLKADLVVWPTKNDSAMGAATKKITPRRASSGRHEGKNSAQCISCAAPIKHTVC